MFDTNFCGENYLLKFNSRNEPENQMTSTAHQVTKRRNSLVISPFIRIIIGYNGPLKAFKSLRNT